MPLMTDSRLDRSSTADASTTSWPCSAPSSTPNSAPTSCRSAWCPSVEVADDGVVTVGIKLTIGGCPLRADIKREVETRVGLHPGVTEVTIAWGEMNAEERQPGDDQGPLERPAERTRHRGAPDLPGAGDRQRQGRRRQELGHGQPRRRARHRPATPSASSTPTSGASPSPVCSASTDRMEAERSTAPTSRRSSPTSAPSATGCSRSCRPASSSTSRRR